MAKLVFVLTMLSAALLVSFSKAFSLPPILHSRINRLSRSFHHRLQSSSTPLLQDLEVNATNIIPSTSAWIPPNLVGVIFDMDGTLLKPVIDFAEMRRRIYQVAQLDLGRDVQEGCVLELADQLSPEGRKLAYAVFFDIEQKAIQNMQFEDGLAELCQWLDARQLRRAVLTRNVRTSVDAMHSLLQNNHGVASFSPAVARDTRCGKGNLLPPKPHPDAIHYICEQWQCHVSQVIMVGDSANDDIAAATRAGCGASVLLSSNTVHDNNSGNDRDTKMEERIPTVTLESLSDFHKLLINNFE